MLTTRRLLPAQSGFWSLLAVRQDFAKASKRQAVDLGDSGLMNVQDLGDLLHAEFPVIVQLHDLAVSPR